MRRPVIVAACQSTEASATDASRSPGNETAVILPDSEPTTATSESRSTPG
jgi:hypothetical protein